MKKKDLIHFVNLVKDENDYNFDFKSEFQRLGRRVAKELAKHLGLEKKDYTITNKSSDIVLESNNLYINIGKSAFRKDFLYRKKGINQNLWLPFNELLNMPTLVDKIKRGVTTFGY